MTLRGHVALVTGASRGIGRAIAIGLAREGADVAINFHKNRAAAEDVASKIESFGRRALIVEADVSVNGAAEHLIGQTTSGLGQLDILVNNAGANARTPFLDIESSEFDRIINVNLRGPFLVCQAAGRWMKEHGGGRIVTITSISATRALSGLVHYQMAKAGLAMMTRGMALELAPYNIRVNAVAPGLIETDLTRANLSDPAMRTQRTGRIPAGRLGQPDDIVGAVLYLISDGAAWVTGSTIIVDGCQTILQ